MKKSVIILIGVIYILSIAVVSFMGLKIDTFEETVYVQKIEITNEGVKTAPNGELYIVIPFNSDSDDGTVFQLEWRVYPDYATLGAVKFIYDETITYASVSAFGAVMFYKAGTSISVTITSIDGSMASQKITIYCEDPYK